MVPLSTSAQAGEEGATSEQNLQEPEPSSEQVPEEPALQLKLDDAGVEVVPSPPRTADGYTLDEMKLRVKRARIGLLSTAGVSLVGMGLVIAGARVSNTQPSSDDKPANALKFSGVSLLLGGFAGMIATGIVLKTRRRQLDRYEPRPEDSAYTLEQMELRVKRARLGLGFSVVAMTVVGPLLIGGAVGASLTSCEWGGAEECSPPGVPGLFAAGGLVTAGGLAGTIASGVLLRRRKRDRDSLREAHYRRPRRVQWDLAQSRLVF
jgi:hypothetical protein